eukprot:TRINITY_DN5042_c0_g1_i1.p1 TRINITY_DN5042_c0_g1~~TRINITY_DN5042_c0_g1_i1.p1  ORF type:complete len:443 (-),score=81.11 TRINITY_DN5042_c0_g1_i1:217-1545(-)
MECREALEGNPEAPTSFTHSESLGTNGRLSLLWLCKVAILALSRKVECVCITLHTALRRWSVEFLSSRLLSMLTVLNPQLCDGQRAELLGIVARAMEHLLWNRSINPRVMRGIVALACPDQPDTAVLVTYLMEVIVALSSGAAFLPPDEHCRLTAVDEDAAELGSRMDLDLEAGVLGERCNADGESSSEDSEDDSEGEEVEREEGEGEGEEGEEEEEGVCVGELVLRVGESSNSRSGGGGGVGDVEVGGGGLLGALEDEGEEKALAIRQERERVMKARNRLLELERARREDAAVAKVLGSLFCVDRDYVAVMSAPVRRAVLDALWDEPRSWWAEGGGAGRRARRILRRAASAQGPMAPPMAPVCCITLEPLLVLPECALVDDVVAVIQRHRRRGCGVGAQPRVHADLYRGRALYAWLAATPVPTNPRTRSYILPSDIYRLME